MKSFIIMIMLTIGFHITFAQNKKSEKAKKSVSMSFEVKGVCDMCKERIETAAIYTKGVKHASWNKEAQELTVVYNNTKTTEEKIHNNIAGVGHDTSKAVAEAEAYGKLPECCRYRDGVKVH
jgi:periplasmic mercuric ion binding protein